MPESSFNVMSLNVNGMFAEKLESESGLKKFIEKYDCVFVSETWTNKYSNIDIEGYVKYCKHRKRRKHAKRDSGGLVVYFKENLDKGVEELDWDNEDGMCFKLDRNVFGMKEDLFILTVYMRSSTSTRECVNEDIDCYEKLEEQIACVSDLGAVLIMGDMNARTGEKTEGVVEENEWVERRQDVFGIQNMNNANAFSVNDLEQSNISIERISQDKGTNEYGTKLLNLCNSCNLLCMNGRAFKDKNKGKVTFCNHRGESVIDYVICDKKALSIMNDFAINDMSVFSDHAVISFSFLINHINIENIASKDRIPRMKWKEHRKEQYIENVKSSKITERVSELLERMP